MDLHVEIRVGVTKKSWQTDAQRRDRECIYDCITSNVVAVFFTTADRDRDRVRTVVLNVVAPWNRISCDKLSQVKVRWTRSLPHHGWFRIGTAAPLLIAGHVRVDRHDTSDKPSRPCLEAGTRSSPMR